MSSRARARRALLLSTFVLAALADGCHHARTSALPEEPSTIRVDNHNRLDVDVYLVHQGQHTLLGLVPAATGHDFTIPPRLLAATAGVVRFEAHAIGSGERVFSDPISVSPGTRVRWSLESRLSQSSLTAY